MEPRPVDSVGRALSVLALLVGPAPDAAPTAVIRGVDIDTLEILQVSLAYRFVSDRLSYDGRVAATLSILAFFPTDSTLVRVVGGNAACHCLAPSGLARCLTPTTADLA